MFTLLHRPGELSDARIRIVGKAGFVILVPEKVAPGCHPGASSEARHEAWVALTRVRSTLKPFSMSRGLPSVECGTLDCTVFGRAHNRLPSRVLVHYSEGNDRECRGVSCLFW